jgi:hypothetical protein
METGIEEKYCMLSFPEDMQDTIVRLSYGLLTNP